MLRVAVTRASTLFAAALMGTGLLTCVAHAVQTIKAPSASITTYSLGPGGIKVITPQAGQNVLIMAVCKDSGDAGAAYVNMNHVSNTLLVWEGQQSDGTVTFNSTGIAGVQIAKVDANADVWLEVANPNSIRVHNTSSNLNHTGSVTMIW